MKAAEASCKQVNTCAQTHTHSEVTSLWLLKTHSGPHSCWNNAVCSSVQGQSRPIATLSEGQAPPLAVTSREPRVEWSREHHGSSWGDSVPGSRARKEVSFFSYVFPPFFFLPSFLLHPSVLFSLHPSPLSVHPFMFLFLCRVFSPPSLSSATPAAPGLIGLSRKSLPTAVMWQHCVASCRMPVSVTTWPLFL